jgi:hypothetical protein
MKRWRLFTTLQTRRSVVDDDGVKLRTINADIADIESRPARERSRRAAMLNALQAARQRLTRNA